MSYCVPPKVHPGTPIMAVLRYSRYEYVVIPSPESGLGQHKAYSATNPCQEYDVVFLEDKWVYTPVKFYGEWYGTVDFRLWKGWSKLPVGARPATLAETLEHFPFLREIPGTETHSRLYTEWCDSTQRQGGYRQ